MYGGGWGGGGAKIWILPTPSHLISSSSTSLEEETSAEEIESVFVYLPREETVGGNFLNHEPAYSPPPPPPPPPVCVCVCCINIVSICNCTLF